MYFRQTTMSFLNTQKWTNKRSGQTIIEVTLGLMVTLIFFLATARLFFWTTRSLVERNNDYQETRPIKGKDLKYTLKALEGDDSEKAKEAKQKVLDFYNQKSNKLNILGEKRDGGL